MQEKPASNGTRPLYRNVGSWKTAKQPGSGRSSEPREVNGLQAHFILRHKLTPESVFNLTVKQLAELHTSKFLHVAPFATTITPPLLTRLRVALTEMLDGLH